jgi:hypothetical protein
MKLIYNVEKRRHKMNTYRKNAIIAGALWIIGTVAGVLSLPFLGIVDKPDYLTKIAANENQVITGALLLLIMAFACAGIAISLYPVLKKQNQALALGSVGFRIIENVLVIVSAICLLSLIPLSQEYVKAGASALHFQTLGTLLVGAQDSISNIALIPFCIGALMYYYVFYQSKLIPRWLSGWGLIAIIMNLASALLVLFGLIGDFSPAQVVMSIPIGVQEMVIAVWLIVKGFNPSAIASGSAKIE